MVHPEPDRELLFSAYQARRNRHGIKSRQTAVMKSSHQTSARFSPAKRTLVIMAKAPEPGAVKTRLSKSLPVPAVTALYRCLLEDTLALAKSLTGVQVAVMCRESDKGALAELLGDTIHIVTQRGEGLAAALTSVFRDFTADRQQVIAFNSDSPHLPAPVLDGAFETLTMHDVVVGPTYDGGYYLVGAKTSHAGLFDGDGMGTSTALDRLLTRTRLLGLSTGFTEEFYDVDVADDLVRLSRELQLAATRAPRTAAWFSEWEEAVAELRQRVGKV